jgi:hypothetical protein
VRRKEFERDLARRFRARGYPLRVIAAELGVALSSVSVWVRDVPIPSAPEAVRHLTEGDEPEIESDETRCCGRCHSVLPVSAFNRYGDGYQWWCRECFREYFRKRGELHRSHCRTGKRKRRKAAKAFIRGYLATHPCVDCGESDRDLLEFDHLGQKRDHLSRLSDAGYSQRALETEIQGCEVVCVNCHRRRTARRSSWWRGAPNWRKAPAPQLPAVARNLIYAYSYLEAAGCVDCGLTDLRVLDFDHEGEKQASVVVMARHGCSLKRLIAEIEQCEVRCANCHRRRTAQKRRADQTRAKLKSPP